MAYYNSTGNIFCSDNFQIKISPIKAVIVYFSLGHSVVLIRDRAEEKLDIKTAKML